MLLLYYPHTHTVTLPAEHRSMAQHKAQRRRRRSCRRIFITDSEGERHADAEAKMQKKLCGVAEPYHTLNSGITRQWPAGCRQGGGGKEAERLVCLGKTLVAHTHTHTRRDTAVSARLCWLCTGCVRDVCVICMQEDREG